MELADFEDDERLERIDFRRLAGAVHPDATHVITSFDRQFIVDHRMVITELGLCHVINAPIAVLLQQSYVLAHARVLVCVRFGNVWISQHA